MLFYFEQTGSEVAFHHIFDPLKFHFVNINEEPIICITTLPTLEFLFLLMQHFSELVDQGVLEGQKVWGGLLLVDEMLELKDFYV